MVQGKIRKKYQNWKAGIRPGLEVSISSKSRLLITGLLSFTIFFLLVLSSFPEYSYQMLTSGIFYWCTAFKDLLQNMLISVGLGSIVITAFYSVFTSIAILHAGISLKNRSFEGKSLASVSPGLLVTGCAGCGAGILGLLGFASAVTLFPFEGDLVKLAGIVLLLYFIGDSGNPEICRV
jgi:hypothetical protein